MTHEFDSSLLAALYWRPCKAEAVAIEDRYAALRPPATLCLHNAAIASHERQVRLLGNKTEEPLPRVPPEVGGCRCTVLLQASSLFPALGPRHQPLHVRHAPDLVAELLRQKSLEYSLDIILGIESIRLPALSFTNPWESSIWPGEMRSSRLFRRPHFRFDWFYYMPPNVKQVPSNIATASAGTSVP